MAFLCNQLKSLVVFAIEIYCMTLHKPIEEEIEFSSWVVHHSYQMTSYCTRSVIGYTSLVYAEEVLKKFKKLMRSVTLAFFVLFILTATLVAWKCWSYRSQNTHARFLRPAMQFSQKKLLLHKCDVHNLTHLEEANRLEQNCFHDRSERSGNELFCRVDTGQFVKLLMKLHTNAHAQMAFLCNQLKSLVVFAIEIYCMTLHKPIEEEIEFSSWVVHHSYQMTSYCTRSVIGYTSLVYAEEVLKKFKKLMRSVTLAFFVLFILTATLVAWKCWSYRSQNTHARFLRPAMQFSQKKLLLHKCDVHNLTHLEEANRLEQNCFHDRSERSGNELFCRVDTGQFVSLRWGGGGTVSSL